MTTTTDNIHSVPCPHTDCQHTLSIRDTNSAGVYTCSYCLGRFKLAWATYLAGGRKPYLVAVSEAERG